ncbi:MAG: lipid A deacylase LpxR family protein [bacterium]|nr:lipid A deacylase LpxR family protein [bacterium]
MGASTASAQGLVHLRIDNDSFAQIDRWYSHRHELGWTGQIYRAPDGPTVALQVRAGQAMWTPRNIQFVDPPERDMPFAGYLYGDVGRKGHPNGVFCSTSCAAHESRTSAWV